MDIGIEKDFMEWTIKAHLNERCEQHRGFREALFLSFKAGYKQALIEVEEVIDSPKKIEIIIEKAQ